MKSIFVITFLVFVSFAGSPGFSAESAPSVVIRISDGRITATDAKGKRVADDFAGKDDAALLQAVIDGSGRGRKITLGAGRYVLQRPLLMDRACVVEGEGRETVLVPPKDDFALRIIKGNVVVQSCTFHDAAKIGREFAVEATGGRVTFASNTIDSERDNRLLLTAVRSAIITGNQFTLATEHPTIHLAEDGTKGCANVVIANNTFTETRAKCAIQREAQSTGGIEVHGNIFGGTYVTQAVIEPNK